VTPADLLAAARQLLGAPAGAWPRGAALLTRQALEATLDELWAARAPGLIACTMRSQLTCLPYYVEEATAREIGYLWHALSEACHYHAYELAPTAGELAGWIDAVDRVLLFITTVVLVRGPS
jgi:hypothetical protein